MKKLWAEPEVNALELCMTANDLVTSSKEDDLSYRDGFPAFDCKCS